MTTPRLHLLMNPAALDDCLRQRAGKDAVLLLDRGVELLARAAELRRLLADGAAVVACEPDRRARGLPLIDEVGRVDDAGLVDLVARHEQVLSWT